MPSMRGRRSGCGNFNRIRAGLERQTRWEARLILVAGVIDGSRERESSSGSSSSSSSSSPSSSEWEGSSERRKRSRFRARFSGRQRVIEIRREGPLAEAAVRLLLFGERVIAVGAQV